MSVKDPKIKKVGHSVSLDPALVAVMGDYQEHRVRTGCQGQLSKSAITEELLIERLQQNPNGFDYVESLKRANEALYK